NMIIAIGVTFCVVAVGAGLLIAFVSSPNKGTGTPQATSIASTTSQARPTNSSASAAPAATAAATAAPATSAPTQAPSAATAVPATPAATSKPAPTAAPAAAPTIAATGYVEYTVQKGDILGRIAQKYDVSVREILAINDIANPDSLTVGQVLRIPQK
ncbi:MAG TPA: LysM domain-containing protein, partial [Roseiflexaceae bacterium]